MSINFHHYIPKLSDEGEIPLDDLFLIGLAIHSESVLISTDARLKLAIEKVSSLSKYSLKIKHRHEITY